MRRTASVGGCETKRGVGERSGLHVGSLGGVVVDEQMVTSDPRIQAVGDVVEVKNLITGAGRIIPF